jgi:hypothetical protein
LKGDEFALVSLMIWVGLAFAKNLNEETILTGLKVLVERRSSSRKLRFGFQGGLKLLCFEDLDFLTAVSSAAS